MRDIPFCNEERGTRPGHLLVEPHSRSSTLGSDPGSWGPAWVFSIRFRFLGGCLCELCLAVQISQNGSLAEGTICSSAERTGFCLNLDH